MTDTQQASDEEIAAPEPLSTGVERVYDEIHGEPVAELVQRLRKAASYAAWTEDEDRWNEAATTIERLQRELDERPTAISVEKLLLAKLGREWTPSGISIVSLIDELAARARAAEASLAKAREALKPFAEQAERYDPHEGDDDIRAWDSFFTIGDLRAARAILGDQP